MKNCPCQSGIAYMQCCGRFIDSHIVPENPEQLMRSRYTAYAIMNIDYIAKTMKGPALLHFDKEQAKQWSQQLCWQKLTVIASQHNNNHGVVEFMAYYSHNDNNRVIHEKSEFIREQGVWYYVDGTIPKIERNTQCPCGSQKKYKKCCGIY